MSKVCVHCKRSVDELEGIVDEFMCYHTHCYYLVKSKRMNKLQNKLEGKTIILEEAEELAEITTILTNLKKFVDAPSTTTKQIFGASEPRFFGKSNGMRKLDQHIQELKKHKKLEATRADKPKQLPHKTNKVFQIGNEKH